MDGLASIALLAGPALLALLALFGGIALLRRRSEDEGTTHKALRAIFGALLLVGALGIGTCYALFFATDGFGPH